MRDNDDQYFMLESTSDEDWNYIVLFDETDIRGGRTRSLLSENEFYISYNGKDWKRWIADPDNYNSRSLYLDAGEKVYIKGNFPNGLNGYRFSTDSNVKAYGNIMSLIYGDDFKDKKTIPAAYCFNNLFNDCSYLEKAPALPATELAEGCYAYMFRKCTSLTRMESALPASIVKWSSYGGMFWGCTSLTQAPDIKATTLEESACQWMFRGCSSLIQAPRIDATTLGVEACCEMFWDCSSLVELPELPATEMSEGCYRSMFVYCTSAERAPRLPATSLAKECYEWMYYGCTNLNYVEVAFDQWPPATDSVTFEWLGEVAEEGTFVCPASLPDVRGISNIPSGWTKTESPLAKGSIALRANHRKAAPQARRARTLRMPQPKVLKKKIDSSANPSAAPCCR